jgi:hypothetical protein
MGTGGGAFAPSVSYPTGIQPRSVAIADLNADGNPDVVVANTVSNTVSVLLGNGDGTFAPRQDFGSGRGPSAVATADMNGDGNPDVVVANTLESTVAVLLNQLAVTAVPQEPRSSLRVGPFTPNPARAGARLRLELPARARVRATIHDIAGRTVRTIADAEFTAGAHALAWDGTGGSSGRVAPGLYFCRVVVDGRETTRRVVVIP